MITAHFMIRANAKVGIWKILDGITLLHTKMAIALTIIAVYHGSMESDQ